MIVHHLGAFRKVGNIGFHNEAHQAQASFPILLPLPTLLIAFSLMVASHMPEAAWNAYGYLVTIIALLNAPFAIEPPCHDN